MIGRVLSFLRTPVGRRVLLFVLLGAVALLAWRFMDRFPSEGAVEVRWTGARPDWVEVGYVNEAGATVRWNHGRVPPEAASFLDRYDLSPGSYWLHVRVKQGERLHSVRKKVELPTAEPLVLSIDASAE